MLITKLAAVAGVVVLVAGCAAVPAATSPNPSASAATASPSATSASTPSPTASPTATPAPTVLPTPTASAEPTVTVTPTASPAGPPQWKRVPDQESFSHSIMNAVVGGTDQFVAVGTAWSADEAPTGLAWTSTDGSTWTRAAELGEGEPAGIIFDGFRYVAFGGGGGVVPAMVWTSGDGQTWQPATGIPGEEVIVLYVTSLNGTLYAIGGTFGGDGEVPSTDVFSTWTSSDGLNWQPVAAQTPPPELNLLGGLTGANDVLVAWGTQFDDDGSSHPVVLRSSDGSGWEQGTLGGVDEVVNDIVGGANGMLVAVGNGPYCCEAGGMSPIRAWTSADGLTWQAATFDPEPGNDSLDRVDRYGDGYLSLGSNWSVTISWQSTDGMFWTEAASVPDTEADGDPCTGGPCPNTTLHDLAAGSIGRVAVGTNRVIDENTGGIIDHRSVVWIALPTG